MTFYSYGFRSSPSDIENEAEESQLFSQNVELLFEHEQEIYSVAEYFFCSLSFAWCSFPYIGGDGPLYLGYLMLGYRHGTLLTTCPACEEHLLITNFGGSPLSGDFGVTGYCMTCCQFMRRRESGHRLMNCSLDLRNAFPVEIREWEEFDGFVFSWGGNGLKPARKKRLKVTRVAREIRFGQAVDELRSELENIPEA